jgi:hypothetical protein
MNIEFLFSLFCTLMVAALPKGGDKKEDSKGKTTTSKAPIPAQRSSTKALAPIPSRVPINSVRSSIVPVRSSIVPVRPSIVPFRPSPITQDPVIVTAIEVPGQQVTDQPILVEQVTNHQPLDQQVTDQQPLEQQIPAAGDILPTEGLETSPIFEPSDTSSSTTPSSSNDVPSSNLNAGVVVSVIIGSICVLTAYGIFVQKRSRKRNDNRLATQLRKTPILMPPKPPVYRETEVPVSKLLRGVPDDFESALVYSMSDPTHLSVKSMPYPTHPTHLSALGLIPAMYKS